MQVAFIPVFHNRILSPVCSLLSTAIQTRVENFGVEWVNQMPLLQLQVWWQWWICSQVLLAENLLTNLPSSCFHRAMSSPWFAANRRVSISFSTSFKILTLCLLLLHCLPRTSDTKALSTMPNSIRPRSPRATLRRPCLDQKSYQKEVSLQENTSIAKVYTLLQT